MESYFYGMVLIILIVIAARLFNNIRVSSNVKDVEIIASMAIITLLFIIVIIKLYLTLKQSS